MKYLNFPGSYVVDGDGNHQAQEHEMDDVLEDLISTQSFVVQSAESPEALCDNFESEEVSIGSACDDHVIWKDWCNGKWKKAIRNMSKHGEYIYYTAHGSAELNSLDQEVFYSRNDIENEMAISPQAKTKSFRDYLNNAYVHVGRSTHLIGIVY